MTLVLNFQGAGAGNSSLQDKATKTLLLRIFAGFWILGLLNNSAYVIMIAGRLATGYSTACYLAMTAASTSQPLTCPASTLPHSINQPLLSRLIASSAQQA